MTKFVRFSEKQKTVLTWWKTERYKNCDAVILAKSCPEELTEEDVRKLDLYNVSELKFSKGVCEIKFADRIKAVEKLNEIRAGKAADNAAQSFLDAIGEAGEKFTAEVDFPAGGEE